MPKMLQISKTRRDMLYLWWHATRQHRGGQEAGRATKQLSTHHVRPWNSQFSIEDYSKGSTPWKLCSMTETQKSKRLLELRGEAKLRNDFGALPRGRAVSRAHARTRMHAIRHGRIWQNCRCKEELRRFLRRACLLQRPIQGRTTVPRRRQRHRKDRRTPWLQTHCTVDTCWRKHKNTSTTRRVQHHHDDTTTWAPQTHRVGALSRCHPGHHRRTGGPGRTPTVPCTVRCDDRGWLDFDVTHRSTLQSQQKGKTWPNNPQNPTLNSGHRTWKLSSRPSWWDSSSSQTWWQSPQPTSSDVPALVLNTRKNTSSERPVVATQVR